MRRRKVYGASLPKPPRRNPADLRRPSICIECGRGIDLVAVKLAIDTGREYVHGCGRRLYEPE